MKEKMNFVKNVLIILYILIIIFITICLLSYNDYQVTEFGSTTLLPVIDENLEPDYSVGDLLIIKKKISDVSVGNTIFFYRSVYGETVVNFAKITDIEIVTEKEKTITVEGDYKFSSQYLIGKTSTTTIIPMVGHVVSLLESKYGFLFLGVLPSLLVFLYTGYSLFLESTSDDEDDESEEKKTKKKKSSKAKSEPKEEKVESAKSVSEEEKKALIEEKMKSMTEEQKKALIEEKLKSMTEEQKKALLEAKRKKMEENK